MEQLEIVLSSPGDLQVALLSTKSTFAIKGRHTRWTKPALIGFQTLKPLTKSCIRKEIKNKWKKLCLNLAIMP